MLLILYCRTWRCTIQPSCSTKLWMSCFPSAPMFSCWDLHITGVWVRLVSDVALCQDLDSLLHRTGLKASGRPLEVMLALLPSPSLCYTPSLSLSHSLSLSLPAGGHLPTLCNACQELPPPPFGYFTAYVRTVWPKS